MEEEQRNLQQSGAGGTVLRCVYVLLLLAVDLSVCSNNSVVSSAVLKSRNSQLPQLRFAALSLSQRFDWCKLRS